MLRLRNAASWLSIFGGVLSSQMTRAFQDVECPFVTVLQPGSAALSGLRHQTVTEDLPELAGLLTRVVAVVANADEVEYIGSGFDALSLDPIAFVEARSPFCYETVESMCGVLSQIGIYVAGYEYLAFPPPPP